MNRTIQEATVHRFHYDSREQLNAHLKDFINAYNFASRLKARKGLTPYEFLCQSFKKEPESFNLSPSLQIPDLYN